ncbi:predicted protein, partial [Nematostella vectensis]
MGVIAWYEINKDYIAAELCENKDKPELQCAGKCYLKKQIDKVEESGDTEDKNTPTKNKKTELPDKFSDKYETPNVWAVAIVGISTSKRLRCMQCLYWRAELG